MAGDRLGAADPPGDWVSSPLPAAGASPSWGPACAPAVVAISVDCGGAVRVNERVAERAARLWACRVDPLERSGRLRARRVERRGRLRGIGSLLPGWDSRRVVLPVTGIRGGQREALTSLLDLAWWLAKRSPRCHVCVRTSRVAELYSEADIRWL